MRHSIARIPKCEVLHMRYLKLALTLCPIAFNQWAPTAISAPAEHAVATNSGNERLIGAWRLVSIDYSGPNGALTDPDFGPNPEGIIIYDKSGWMSVQIVTANRPAMVRPATRASGSATPEEASAKAAAFDTYYAYFGTWTYDAAKSVITHHLKSSLLPYEAALDKRREVSLEGGRLKLTVHTQEMGRQSARSFGNEYPAQAISAAFFRVLTQFLLTSSVPISGG